MKTKLRNLVIAAVLTLSAPLASSGEPVSKTLEAVSDHPGCVIGGSVGYAYGGPVGGAFGTGVGCIVEKQSPHLDPGPAIGREARRTEKKIRKKIRKIF